jgi:hypothetical protein
MNTTQPGNVDDELKYEQIPKSVVHEGAHPNSQCPLCYPEATFRDDELKRSLALEIFNKCEKPLEYVTKLVIADAEDGELRGMSVREYSPDMIKTRYSKSMAEALTPFIKQYLEAHKLQLQMEARIDEIERTVDSHRLDNHALDYIQERVDELMAELNRLKKGE